jgi:tRNA (cytosine34-C5)-methyltransferase
MAFQQVLSNIKFEAFYRAMHILEADEWEQFLETLRDPLPACFRINADYAFADSLRKQLHDFAGQKTIIDDKEVDGVVQLPWYPGGYAYKLGYDRRTIRKNDSLSGLHKWMIQHTDSGNITRQEAVSMVPPIALDVQPHHRCLDMCAAPGSKTSQLLEIVGKSLHDTEAQMGPNPPPLGVVVANDADTDRAYMLVRIPSLYSF